ncbi:MAG TPA: hypothetical protein VK157_02515 [Phycisphaerales bacterium]|nr:hypothetical protein [Phycisphaerales bacterium]
MSYWTLRIGIAFIAIGFALLSPVADLLPLDFWPKVKSLFSTESSSAVASQNNYVRVVPAEPSRALEVAFIAAGLLLVAIGLYFRAKE